MLLNNCILFNFFLLFFATTAKSDSNYRLPNTTIPRVYTIQFDPYLFDKEFSFNGQSSIIFQVIQPTNLLVLHKSKNIIIDSNYTTITDDIGGNYKIINELWIPNQEFIKFKINNSLQIGNYTLKLRWKGLQNEIKFNGFYRTIDYDNQNNPTYIAVMNLRPVNARSVFPCWDEPNYRSIYKISVKHPLNYIALSNMPKQITQIVNDSTAITTFIESIPLSSYQVSVVITEYDSITNNYKNMTIYSGKDELTFVQYLLRVHETIITLIEEYLEIPFGLPKLDSVSMPQFPRWPTSFSIPGLIIHKSYKFKSINEKSSNINYMTQFKISKSTIEQVFQQWFENLVIPVWWSDYWLCEGISLYLQSKLIDQLFPSFQYINYQTIEKNEILFILDSNEIFIPPPLKSVPQKKSLIKKKLNFTNSLRSFIITQMLEHVVTPNVLLTGLKQFFKDYQFKAATIDDFWSSLQKIYDTKFINNSFSIKENMDPWLSQLGYPIVNITRDYQTGLVKISQLNALSSYKNITWNIPITYATRSQPNFDFTSPSQITWIKQNQSSITLSGIDPKDWIIVNIQQRGYYKVKYDMTNLNLIINYLYTKDYNKIHYINRARIIDDITQAYIDSDDYFAISIRLIGYLHQETNHLVWLTATNLIDEIIKSTNINKNNLFKNYINIITTKMINELNMTDNKNDSSQTLVLRRNLLSIFCQFNYDKCKPIAYQIFNSSIVNPYETAYFDNVYKWALCNVFEDFNTTQWDNFYLTDFPSITYDSTTKFKYLYCAKSNKILEKYLNHMIDSNNDEVTFTIIFENIIHHNRRNNNEFLLNYFIQNFDILQKKFLEMNQLEDIPLLIKLLATNIDNSDQWKKFTLFIDSQSTELNHKYPVYKDGVMKVISSLANKKNSQHEIFERIYMDVFKLLKL